MGQHLVLPDLTAFIPGWLPPRSNFDQFLAYAYRYDALDYDQLLAGFPYKGNDGRLFPVARSGMRMVTKNF